MRPLVFIVATCGQAVRAAFIFVCFIGTVHSPLVSLCGTVYIVEINNPLHVLSHSFGFCTHLNQYRQCNHTLAVNPKETWGMREGSGRVKAFTTRGLKRRLKRRSQRKGVKERFAVQCVVRTIYMCVLLTTRTVRCFR